MSEQEITWIICKMKLLEQYQVTLLKEFSSLVVILRQDISTWVAQVHFQIIYGCKCLIFKSTMNICLIILNSRASLKQADLGLMILIKQLAMKMTMTANIMLTMIKQMKLLTVM